MAMTRPSVVPRDKSGSPPPSAADARSESSDVVSIMGGNATLLIRLLPGDPTKVIYRFRAAHNARGLRSVGLDIGKQRRHLRLGRYEFVEVQQDDATVFLQYPSISLAYRQP